MQHALNWYRQRSLQAAAGFEAAFDIALAAIHAAPERWTKRGARYRFYSLRRYPYSVLYRVSAENILIVAVAHTSRSARSWRGRD